MTSDSFPVSAAGDDGTQQLLVRAKQGGIVGRRRPREGKNDSAFE